MMQRLLLNGHLTQLLANGERAARGEDTSDCKPVVKLFNPSGAGTWLLSEIDPANPSIAFGLCDLGMGCPEIGSVDLSELTAYRGPLNLGIERDIHFKATMTLSEYADQARRAGSITA